MHNLFKDNHLTLTLTGHLCKNGHLCGLVTKYGQRLRDPEVGAEEHCNYMANKLTYLGFHDPQSGEPKGPIYKVLLGESIMYSESKKFSGQNIAYMYHKNNFAILGEFDDSSLLINGQKVAYEANSCDSNGMLGLKFAKPVNPEVVYHYKPPTYTSFGDQPLTPDELATEWIEVKFVSKFKVKPKMGPQIW